MEVRIEVDVLPVVVVKHVEVKVRESSETSLDLMSTVTYVSTTINYSEQVHL